MLNERFHFRFKLREGCQATYDEVNTVAYSEEHALQRSNISSEVYEIVGVFELGKDW